MDETEYGRCMFCKNFNHKYYEKNPYTTETGEICHCAYSCGGKFLNFSIDGKRVAEKAKELGISVTDVLALMEANINFRFKRKS